ncbi:MAG: 50S ribosomal protein L6 [Bacteroidales bacterium]|jgi:large subunit ribosomal protein L6|nr:50S ribosomal protein L6 [Bacteroidales bacterium]MDD2618081.1 50S ribosomal protein L6 [Bacteroidales bacterium]MDD4640148.1 50S ribosomal protein L6 [Bacteroidales bacterium]NLB02742.1 50S ribosomal protein L6 [Bacteroidales bacterium]
MSRIGKLPIAIPSKVSVEVDNNNVVSVKGPKGQLQQLLTGGISIEVKDDTVYVSRPSEDKEHRALHGLYRALIHNMVVGVSEGFRSVQELVGVGYRASNDGQLLKLALGYTHEIYMLLPQEVKVETKSERNKNPLIMLESCDKQLLGQICAKIRSFRKPEPYKGKGIRFQGEVVRRKAGKSAAKK